MTNENILQLDRIEEYREGNQLEAKAAQGGMSRYAVGQLFGLCQYRWGLHPAGSEGTKGRFSR